MQKNKTAHVSYHTTKHSYFDCDDSDEECPTAMMTVKEQSFFDFDSDDEECPTAMMAVKGARPNP